MRTFINAVRFLTTLPIPSHYEFSLNEIGKSAGWFPFIGLIIGLLSAGFNFLLMMVFPLLLSALLTTIFWISLTGGLHLDGTADSCDGLLNASNKERKLEIMKDPRLGTFGGIGLISIVLLKMITIYSLSARYMWIALPLAAASARWLLILAGKQPLARPNGSAATFANGLNHKTFFFGGLSLLCILAFLIYHSGWLVLIIFASVHIVFLMIIKLATNRIGGITGDILGLIVETTECITLLGFCMLS